MDDTLIYKLDNFDGPLDLLLMLIQKNKVSITDIPISLICRQYIDYLNQAREMNMDIASDFIVMASELMLIKSKMLLPRQSENDEDPRTPLAELLIKYKQAKDGALRLGGAYSYFSSRMVKDTDELSPDKTYVADTEISSLVSALRHIAAEYGARPRDEKSAFTPMIATPVIPVEVKIIGILHHIKVREKASLSELLNDSVSLPDMIAVFLGVLELVKMRRILLIDDEESPRGVWGTDAVFTLCTDNKPDNTETTDSESIHDDSE